MNIEMTPKALLNAVKELETQKSGLGFLKIFLASSILLTASIFVFNIENDLEFILMAILTGFLYAYALIPTHDAIHYTLTGYKWIDELYARVVSYPIAWTHGTYAELHKIHHKMNGVEGRDPERKNPTEEEYHHKNPILRFYYRHRFMIDTFVLSGAGLMYINLRDGIKFGKFSRSVRRALILDIALIAITHAIIIYLLLPYGVGRFYLQLVIYERISGAILHFRAHIEHDSLEPQGANYYEQQISSCRNIETWDLVSRYYNRLNYHSIHHAFPRIPFYNLKEGHLRIKIALEGSHIKLVEDSGYLSAAKNILNNKSYYEVSEKDRITKTIWV